MTMAVRARAALLLLGAALLLPSRAGAASAPWTLYDKTHGLAENTVQAIARDGAGGLWVGTRGGLSRFDGARWQTWTVADGLPDNDVHGLFPDGPERLWVGAGGGFGRIEGGRWSRLGIPGAQAGERGRVAVVTDRAGVTWLGHRGGLLRFDRAAGVLEPVAELAGRPVGALLADREGRLWAGVAGELWRWEHGAWAADREAATLPSGPVTALFEDARGTVWCGGERGVAEYDGAFWRPARFGPEVPAAAVTALAEDGEGRVWVGTGAGAGYSDGYSWHWFDARSGLPADQVLALAADANGSVWVGTPRGLARFDSSWEPPAALAREELAPRPPLLRGRDGTVYLAAERGFVAIRSGAAEAVGPRERVEGRVSVFAEDEAGDLWVGTDQGLVRYDGRVREVHQPRVETVAVQLEYQAIVEMRKIVVCDPAHGLLDAQVTALAPDGEGGIWVGTRGGLGRLRDGVWTCLDESHPLARRAVTALARDGAGRLWAGTADGLWTPEGEGWRRLGRGEGLAADAVTALFVDRAGRLWVGTDRGVSRREGDGWVTFTTREGLVSNRVLAIAEGARDRMWFGTQEGVSFLEDGVWGAFGERDGLPAPQVGGIAEVDGRAWFATADGVVAHRPDRAPPDTRVKNPPAGPVASPSYLFELAGSDLETPSGALRYSWRVDGGPWSPWSPDTLAPVADLANGRHLFEARALDRELNADPSPAAVTFEVNTGLFDVELAEASFEPLFAALYQFYATDPDYARRPVGRVTLRSRYDRPLRVKVGVFIADLMDFPTDAVVTLGAGETLTVPLRIELNDRALDIVKTETRQLRLTLQYTLGGERKESESTHAVTVIERSGMSWTEPARVGLYVTHRDEAVDRFARETVRRFRDAERAAIVYDNLLRAMELFDALGAAGLRYVPDPDNPYAGLVAGRPTLDVVRLPRDTLRVRTGDCDDLAVLYAALLENIGIDTALVDVGDHVFVMFDTGLTGRQARQLAADSSLVHRDERGRLWVPVEVTMVGKPFSEAWQSGAGTLATRRFTTIEMKDAWRTYAPLNPRAPAPDLQPPPLEAVRPLFLEDLRRQEEALTSPEMKRLRERVAEDPGDAGALNALGVLLARRGYLGQAAARFRRVIELVPRFAGGYGNLANVLYEQGRYQDAVQSYETALRLEDRPEVRVELALTFCELGRFDLAREHYRRAMALDPGLEGERPGAQAAGDGAPGARPR
jgi:ligand-binding sensor domain-containing protein